MNQILIEIYHPAQNEVQSRRLSRKLGLLCYFLNTRLDSNLQFVHGGVFVRPFVLDYNPSNNQTRFEVVINQKYVITNASYLDDENVTEDDFRGFSAHFMETLSGLCSEFNVFRSYNFVNYAPIVVSRYYTKEAAIDGRYHNYSFIGRSYNSGFNTGYQNFGGSQYHQQMSGSYLASQAQNIVSTSINRTQNVNVVNTSVSGRKTVVDVDVDPALVNDSVNKITKKMSTIITA